MRTHACFIAFRSLSLCCPSPSKRARLAPQVTAELEDVQTETEVLKKQLASERMTVRNLESLLSTNRQKEFQTQLSASEREAELKLLHERLNHANGKM